MTGKVLVVVGLTLVSYPLGLLLGSRWLLPILNTAPAWLVMVRLLGQDRRRDAVVMTLVWAVALGVCGTTTFALWPSPPGDLVLRGEAYRDEMFEWIRTGQGREGDIRRFLPQHLGHLAGFVAVSLTTASAVSMAGGAVLMNYMSFYVASLAREGLPRSEVILFGWQPWAICRVAAFCILGVVLAEPVLGALGRLRRPALAGARPWLLAAAAGILLDWILKAVLAPAWGERLRPLLGP